MSTLVVLKGFSTISNSKMWIWRSKLWYEDFYLSYTILQRDFLQIVKCLSSTCTQSTLPLHTCKENNFFPEDDNGWEEASSN